MNARERILDAAAEVLRAHGIAATTTRAIARAAGCSEGLLYKHFADKHEIFLAVLSERMPRLSDPASLVGQATVPANLQTLVGQLIDFYVQSFPMSASLFGTPSLRDAHRGGVGRHGGGPDRPALLMKAYLDAEVAAARLSSSIDTEALGRVLTGAALFEAFQATYRGESSVPDSDEIARAIVAAAAAGLGDASDAR